MGDECAEVLAHQPFADVGVPVAVRAELGGAVVHVQSPQAIEAEARVHPSTRSSTVRGSVTS